MKSYNSGPSDKGGKHRINHEIKVPEVRLIDADNKPIGIRSRAEALSIAELRNLDLVEIAPTAKPPVCKLIDYGKFLYEQQKKEKTQKKNQKKPDKVETKEIRFTPNTGDHDFNFKLKHARGFIEDGNKVKASVMFRGRELAHSDIGRDLLLKFIEEMSDIAKVDNPLSNEGRSISVTLSPLKGSKPAKPSRPLKTEQKTKD